MIVNKRIHYEITCQIRKDLLSEMSSYENGRVTFLQTYLTASMSIQIMSPALLHLRYVYVTCVYGLLEFE